MKPWLGFGLCLALLGCGAKAPESTGGFQLDPNGSACPAGYAISNSDFTSTNISAISPTGAVLSASVISSGSAPPGLTTALSGDVVFPSTAPASGKMVLIDRYPNSVLTWVDPATGSVIQQLPVGTGFGANPHDYLELAVNKAYVSRYESNPKPGQAPLDAGGDLLIIDPQANKITGRVELATAPDGAFLPRADRLLLVGSDVWVSLQRFDADFKTAGDARLVGVDPVSDAITWTLDLPGIANCGGVARSPSGKVVALACSGVAGDVDPEQNPAPTLRSAVVLLDATVQPPVVLTHFAAAAALGAPIGSTITFANETTLVSVALGDLTAKRTDVAFTLDTSLGMPQMLLDAGAAFVLGDVHCAPGCTDLCFLADAQANALDVWNVTGATLSAQPSIATDTSIGLPPRAIGAL
ncbi:MAG TPA: hypothetical protein VIK01_16140 [Polyangiaceae bacterium]